MTDATKAILIKVLTVIGFAVTIVLIIWLIAVLFGRVSGGFNSLATIADSINLRKEITALDVVLEKNVVNSGEPFKVSWTDTRTDGTYQLGVPCTEGMHILFRDPEGTFRPIRCDAPLTLPHTVTTIALVASSTKDRFADTMVRVGFVDMPGGTPISGEAKLTIVNAAIPVGGSTTTATSTPPRNTTQTTPTTGVSTSTPAQIGTSTISTTPSAPVRTITTYTYPQSDPHGFTDLAVTATPVAAPGTYGQTFVQFTVKNIGTKTSADWSFVADIPGTTDYTSTRYSGLKPQEYMIFTMGFSTDNTRDTRATYTVLTASDTNPANNTASTNVR